MPTEGEPASFSLLRDRVESIHSTTTHKCPGLLQNAPQTIRVAVSHSCCWSHRETYLASWGRRWESCSLWPSLMWRDGEEIVVCRFVSLCWRLLIRLFGLLCTTASPIEKDAQTAVEGKEKTVWFHNALLGTNQFKMHVPACLWYGVLMRMSNNRSRVAFQIRLRIKSRWIVVLLVWLYQSQKVFLASRLALSKPESLSCFPSGFVNQERFSAFSSCFTEQERFSGFESSPLRWRRRQQGGIRDSSFWKSNSTKITRCIPSKRGLVYIRRSGTLKSSTRKPERWLYFALFPKVPGAGNTGSADKIQLSIQISICFDRHTVRTVLPLHQK